MEELWLEFWRTNWVPNCCYSCVKQEKEGPNNRLRCDKWTLMNPNEYCHDFSLDTIRTADEVITFVQNFIAKNSWI